MSMATGAKALSAIEFLRLCGRLKVYQNGHCARPSGVAGVAEEDKHRMEKEALDEICNTLGNTPSAAEIRELWNEYEAGSTEEAKIVKDFDKFEMILQADDYERAQNIPLDDFFQSTKGKFRTPLVQSWAAELTDQRNARLEGKTPDTK
ncbi:Endopolygalacturonase B [Phytophthora nicotianae]|uniref:Endopolygalacturonase B n=1 Tax=Phytophthora nicotianae TaxID=4792 RepID=A0A0W8DKQ0_PHYNI|nr:Endopolygalacturonase B [Phytophthora nicotianae]